jgi:UDP-N-acetylmuramate--alanine ligase
MFERYRTIHFVGIGGIGMSGIAEVLHNLGYEVTGSDLKDSDTIARLMDMGIRVSIGHRRENIDDAHVVVISSAVSAENPEVTAAREKAVPVIPRAEMLAELGRLKYGILIAGAHGKTTTTSLIATILGNAGLDPTVVIGGRLRATGSNARLGRGDFIIAEADESDGSFLKLTPTVAVVTNIDREHMDFFKNMDTLREAFVAFINKVPFYGLSILCMENEPVREILPRVHRRYVTYGFSEKADVFAVNIEKGFMSVSFDVNFKGRDLGRFFVPMPGMHSVLNSLASIIVAAELKVDIGRIREALRGFRGIQRRFEFKGEVEGIKFFDDYGHHPAEIRATLSAARESLGHSDMKGGRVFVLFQPHRYTRTRDLLGEFGTSFSEADVLCVMDIYAAGERPIDGVNSETLVRAVRESGHRDAVHVTGKDVMVETVMRKLRHGDLFITIGAGDVWKTGEEILRRMKDNAG